MEIVLVENDEEWKTKLLHCFKSLSDSVNVSLFDKKMKVKTTRQTVFFTSIADEKDFNIVHYILEKWRYALIVLLLDDLDLLNSSSFWKVHSFSFVLKTNANWEKQIAETISLAQDVFSSKLIVIKTKIEHFLIRQEEIYYFEKVKSSKKVIIHTTRGQIMFYDSLKSIIKKLNSDFAFSCRSHIVNKNMIEKIDKRSRNLHMRNGDVCPYSLPYAVSGGILNDA